ncbi:MAG: hypothetical protein UT86_C0001G0128 [Candidatus Magasanikbacteria bacterium GW2011_GWC2_40_17]|uniref:YdbS-like PH domain-containing protein n=1 Tax=Candidatus Magasanikbacteria bacterium GW2011_GWA2_42_32 TaxID=1619039 RepID=A0A0G1D5Z4_9BACT|nr:MAG: hypothetical protein UT86_C0001G0128 [Candidatus Magasanikbacteria bacterium GW2011_GWC2_40_17]KKS57488.1 MAG: hypothetical protein UV20_C0001G0128 [Candidatus Magasanikbacteria bacterium GW2011_GWA2_42_32]OGH85204.1 MAG: hypothetical protein A2294_00450 [Candidatus Magasanikbacteria bacterium RIFOXYB2_FULL_38_10]
MSIILHPREQIIKKIRRYYLTYFWHWLLVFIFIAAPFFFMFVLFSWGKWGVGIFIALLVVGLLVLVRGLFFWRKNVTLISTGRILKMEQHGLLNKTVTDLGFYNIRSVSYKIKGFWPTILRYGKIVIETNDDKKNLEILAVKKPAEVTETITLLQQKQLKENSRSGYNLEDIFNFISHQPKEQLNKIKELVDKKLKEMV